MPSTPDPAEPGRWVGGDDLTVVWRSPAPQGMEQVLTGFGARLADPFED